MSRWFSTILFACVLAFPAFAQYDQINLTDDVNLAASVCSINDSGSVIFRTEDGVSLYRGGEPILLVADDDTQNPQINNLGQVVYVSGGAVHLRHEDGTETIVSASLDTTESPAGRPVLNNLGQVAFESDGEIYLFAGAFTATHQPRLTCITADFAPHALRPSLNDLGQIAFQTTEGDLRHVYFFDGTGIRSISGSISDALPSFGRPSLNNSGHIAFERRTYGRTTDIMLYSGASVSNLSLHYEELVAQPHLNDSDQVVCENRISGGIMLFENGMSTKVSKQYGDTSPRINNRGQVCFERAGDIYLAQPGLGAPRVDVVEPSMGSVASTVPISLVGSGFVPSLTVDLRDAGIRVLSVQVSDSAHAAVVIVVGPDARPGMHSISVSVPGGQPSVLPDCFEVLAAEEPLRVSDISPREGEVGRTVSATITGAGFVTGAVISLGDSGISVVSHVVTDKQIQAQLTISRTASLGVHHLTVINPTKVSATLFDTFTVVPETEFQLMALTPNRVTQGEGDTIHINGVGFMPGITLTFDHPGISVSTTYVSPSLLKAQVQVSANTPEGEHALTGVLPQGNRTTLGQALTVVSSQSTLSVESVEPSSVSAGVPASLIVSGSGFREGTVVHFVESDLAASTHVLDAGRMEVLLSVSVEAVPGLRDLLVMRMDGETVRIQNALTVLSDNPYSNVTDSPDAEEPPADPDEEPGDTPASPEPETPVGEFALLTEDIGPSVFYPSINNVGQVTAHNTSRGIFLYSDGQIENVYEGKGGASQINDGGVIVFEAQGMLYWLSDGQAELIGPATQPSLNDVGQLAFKYHDDIFLLQTFSETDVLQAQNLTESLDTEGSQLNLNNSGWVTFAGSDGHIYLHDTLGLRNITATLGFGTTFHDPVLNNHGSVAFAGGGSIYLYDGQTVRAIVEEIATEAGRPSLNDSGHIVFDTGSQGTIYYYAAGVLREVTDGFGRSGFRPVLNNRNEIAFYTTGPGEIYLVQMEGVIAPEAETTPTLRLTVSQTSVPAGSRIEMGLELDTSGRFINGISVELDAAAMVQDTDGSKPELQPVEPGELFPDGSVVLNDVSSDAIRFSMISLESSDVSGRLGTVRWVAPASSQQLTFAGSAKVSLPDGTTQDIAVTGVTVDILDVAAESTIEGQITLQGRDEHDALLELIALPSGGNPLYLDAESNVAGRFELGLPAGTYDLFLRAPGYLWTRASDVAVADVPIAVRFDNGETDALSFLLAGDADGDGTVGLTDFALVASGFGTSVGGSAFTNTADIDGDGSIGLEDFSLVAANFGISGRKPDFAAPGLSVSKASIQMRVATRADATEVNLIPDQMLTGYAVLLQYDSSELRYLPGEGVTQIAASKLVVASQTAATVKFRGPSASTVQFLSGEGVDASGHRYSLQARTLPSATEILPNYPNPFNPETWIPYRLADAAPVRIWIHAASGQLVRSFDLGMQSAGEYVSRERAVYWNGRNNVGEAVSSGVYFCTVRAGEWTATRRLVIVR